MTMTDLINEANDAQTTTSNAVVFTSLQAAIEIMESNGNLNGAFLYLNQARRAEPANDSLADLLDGLLDLTTTTSCFQRQEAAEWNRIQATKVY